MARFGWLPRRLRKGWHEYVHHLPHSVYVAAVIASIVHILNSVGLPLELPATSLLANVAEIYVPAPPRTNDVRRHLAVVEIDQQRFERLYGGTSPLNRCQLKTDLETLLANPELRLLAVDLDLSPIDPAGYAEARRAALDLSAPQAGVERRIRCDSMPDARHGCQCQLESLLEDSAYSARLVTITPLAPAPGRSQGMPTLLPYDAQFELGPTLADASGPVPLNHPHCAKFCVLGGGACSRS